MKPAAFIRPPGVPARDGAFDWPLVLGDAALVLWLWTAAGIFTGALALGHAGAVALALAAAGCSWRLGLHRRPPGQSVPALLGRCLLLVPTLGFLAFAAVALGGPQIGPAFALWFGLAASVLLLAFRLAFWAVRSAWPDQPLEIFRWLALAAAAIALMLPYYGRQGVGSGDAYWYVIMLADFVAQLRHGVFPVWIGQSVYAFNGAVSPLRVAPWFQYCGGFLDLATAHRLEPLALKNALICVNGLVIAAAAYLSLRTILGRRPGLACLLALLWLASPSTVPLLGTNDMYMQFMALPFLPLLLLGCWRLWEYDDTFGRLLIVAALAGMMLSHTPTALWGGLIGGGMYVGQLIARKNWSAEARRLAWMAGLFLVLGVLPLGSALTIDNPTHLEASPSRVAPEVAHAFPADLLPVGEIPDSQVGYALLGAGLVSLMLLAWLRPRGGVAFAAAMLAIVPLTFPVPWLTVFLWTHAPRLFVSIDNVWPMGRLFGFLALLAAFALAMAAADARISRRTWLSTSLLVLLVGGGVWSARQAAKILTRVISTDMDEDYANAYLRPENVALTRYAYGSFATVPPYASHAHMEPLFENRLLDRATRQVITANADAAAPRVRLDSEPETLPRLVQSGVWVAADSNKTGVYKLTPQLRLQPGRRYALRLDFIHPEMEGNLQIKNGDIFREYLLPDSGQGMGNRPSPMAFGASPTSSGVAPLEVHSLQWAEPPALFIRPKYSGEQFEFARFWLFTYTPEELPIRILSWIPYRAETRAAIPTYLETPRIWQRGWRAKVNGRAVAAEASPNNLVMIPLEPGASDVILIFHPPLWLSALFWICFAGWVTLLANAAARVARQACPAAAAG